MTDDTDDDKAARRRELARERQRRCRERRKEGIRVVQVEAPTWSMGDAGMVALHQENDVAALAEAIERVLRRHLGDDEDDDDE